MKKFILLSIIVLITIYFTPLHCFSQNWEWAINDGNRDQGGAQSGGTFVPGNKMTIDDLGFLYVVGNSNSTNNCQIFKMDSAGNKKWTSVISTSSGSIISSDICIDPFANIYFTGGFDGTIYFGSTPLTTDVSKDMFIAKYDSSGVFKWAEKAGAASQTDYGCCIVADSNNVFVSGNFQSGFGAFGTTNFVGNSFLAKYNSAGTFQWVNNLGSNGSPRPYAMTMDNLHNIYITGRAGGTFTYGTTNLGTDANNIFIARYNYSGTCTLVKTTGGTGPNNSYDIALDSDRNIYITGSFSETCAFWNSISLVSSGFKDAFLAKYDTTGCLWAIKAGGTSQDEGCGLFVAGNYVYFTGQFLGSVIFPGTTMPLTSYGDVDIFIAKYNKNTYSKYFVESAGGASGDLGREIIVFNDTNIYVTGANGPAANFGTLTLNSNYLSFIAKYKSCVAPINLSQSSSFACCESDSISMFVNSSGSIPLNYQWRKNGTNITGENNPIFTISSVSISDGATYTCVINNGCGTISSSQIILTVNPLPSNAGSISGLTAICQGQNNITYSVPVIANSTSYTWSLPSGATGTSTTNSITVDYGISAVSGNVTVNGNNSCGDGTVSTLTITVTTLVAAAGIIAGSTTVCQGQNSVTYTVPTITNATSYVWTLPSGATGTSTTNSITVNYGTSATSGNITVKGNNSCGDGTVSTLAITVVPSPPANAGNDTIVCPGLSITLIATGGNSYTWNNGVSQGIPFIPVLTETYTVTVSNGFCTAIDSITVTISTPPAAPVIYQVGTDLYSTVPTGNQWYNDNGLIIGAMSQIYTPTITSNYFVILTDTLGCISDTSNLLYVIVTGLDEFHKSNYILISPNPVTNELTIECKGVNENINFDIINTKGQVVYKGILVEITTVQTSNFAPGVYLIKLDNGKTFEFKKIIKE